MVWEVGDATNEWNIQFFIVFSFLSIPEKVFKE